MRRGGMILCVVLLVGTAWAERFELKAVDDAAFKELAIKRLGVKLVEVRRVHGQRMGVVSNGDRVLLTGDYAAPVGYRGPSSVMLLLDQTMGTVKQAALIESCDSPPYVQRALKKGLMRKLSGIPIRNGELRVDAVSGATRTCVAIEQAINHTLQLLKKE
ncbi:MAG: FMN-binding protein [Kiritimatiellae bacterium]|nr:FMN-binding protein [Kiritimatiellia bacterium]